MTIAVDAATVRFNARRARNSVLRQNARTPRVSSAKNGAGGAGVICGNAVMVTSTVEITNPMIVPTNKLL